jgi:arsenate reductase
MTTTTTIRTRPLILFLCTANSSRSQMAEALLRHHAGDRYEACSAGLRPAAIHPLTLQVLTERGIDTSGLHAKPVAEFLGRASVRQAITVCERTQPNCPRIFPFAGTNLYWPFEDPAAFEGTDERRLAKFRAVRDQIEMRIELWLTEEGVR